jgi:hypothetical protein
VRALRVAPVLLALLVVPALAVAKKGDHARLQSRLTHSKALWATVNFCDTKHHPNAMGIRVSMPGTYRTSKLLMYARFQPQYYSTVKKHRGWKNVPGGPTGWELVGDATETSRQLGHTFRYDPQGFRFRARVSFEWLRKGKVSFYARELTAGGHRNAAGSDPRGHSAFTCVIRK